VSRMPFAERAAHLLFELRFSLSGPNTLSAVQALVSTPDVSYFTRRNGWRLSGLAGEYITPVPAQPRLGPAHVLQP